MHIYTDGGCIENPGGIGAWAFVAVEKGLVIQSGYGSVLETTNNRMELQAVIEAMRWANTNLISVTQISTDSDLTVKCGNRQWKRRANLDLWKDFDEERRRMLGVALVWVRGHAGNVWNEQADRLCTVEMRRLLGWREARQVKAEAGLS